MTAVVLPDPRGPDTMVVNVVHPAIRSVILHITSFLSTNGNRRGISISWDCAPFTNAEIGKLV